MKVEKVVELINGVLEASILLCIPPERSILDGITYKNKDIILQLDAFTFIKISCFGNMSKLYLRPFTKVDVSRKDGRILTLYPYRDRAVSEKIFVPTMFAKTLFHLHEIGVYDDFISELEMYKFASKNSNTLEISYTNTEYEWI